MTVVCVPCPPASARTPYLIRYSYSLSLSIYLQYCTYEITSYVYRKLVYMYSGMVDTYMYTVLVCNNSFDTGTYVVRLYRT